MYWVEPKLDKSNGNITERESWLSDPISVAGIGEDDNERYLILSWTPEGNNSKRSEALPMRDIGEREGWSRLRAGGLSITAKSGLRAILADYLQRSGERQLWTVANATGWQCGAYIMPDGSVIGAPATPVLFNGRSSAAKGYTTKGTPESWRNNVAKLARGNPSMMLGTGRWSWSRQLYGHVYTAKVGDLSDLVAFGATFNDPHLTIAGYETGVQMATDELVAARTARNSVFIRNDPARPTQTGLLNGALPAPVGTRFILSEQQSLLTHGIATAYSEGGVLRIQRDITTYQKNTYGNADNSFLDSETLHTSAYVLRCLKSVITSKYPRHKLANDGTRFGAGQAIVTPKVIKGEMLSIYRQLERAGIVENFELFKQYLIVERNADNPNRLDVLFPPDYVNQLRVFALLNQFRLQYSEEVA
ncbi:phage tail sheath C-terminal domain-containing protein [Yersinia enterocolitica]|uniref:phage tail sheath C-terminal domain-containing protein n=1 Tax=Yersinia enterocolitica TaxID=630 RepID=UPI001E55AC87|nr:phage tail sheath C-terminal domain-containing protein [Yersinia enterocolitica]